MSGDEIDADIERTDRTGVTKQDLKINALTQSLNDIAVYLKEAKDLLDENPDANPELRGRVEIAFQAAVKALS